MELKGKGVVSKGYPPRGLGQRPNSTRAKEPARPPRNPNSQQNRRSLQIPAHSPKGVETIAQNNITTTLHVPIGYRHSYGSSSGIDQGLYPGRHRRRSAERLGATEERTDERRSKRTVRSHPALSSARPGSG